MPEEINERVETTIDRLVDFVQKKGKVSVREVSKALALSVNQVEELADVLQECGLLEIKYGITGVQLISKKIPKERAKESVKKLKEDKEKLRNCANIIASDLSESEKSFEFFDKSIEKRLEKDEQMIDDLEREMKDASVKDMDFLIKEAQNFENLDKKFGGEVKHLSERITKFNKKVEELRVETKKTEEERMGPQKSKKRITGVVEKFKKMIGR